MRPLATFMRDEHPELDPAVLTVAISRCLDELGSED
jgi:hypothetical protein